MMWLTVGIGLMALGVFLFGLWFCLKPMTVCLTFDDGLIEHATIVGPMLNRFGWVGAFNIPTSLVGRDPSEFDERIRRDLCLPAGRALMTWEDVRSLLVRGHEVYPHTCEHVDLLGLALRDREDLMRDQIERSSREYFEHVGSRPRFFCSPHNSSAALIKQSVLRAGMALFETMRPNFGGNTPPGSASSVTQYLRYRHCQGWVHSDIMIHGIVAENGGWRPFRTAEDFQRFLEEVRDLERRRVIRVVRYSRVHWGCGRFHRFLTLSDKVLDKARRIAYGIVIRDKVCYEFPPREEPVWLKSQ